MPRVHFVKQSRKAHPGGIEKGDSYYWWEFRYGGVRYSKTYPSRSQLTQSKKSEAYSAFEALEDIISNRESIEDVSSALDDYRSALESIADEYREAAEPFGGEGENAERAEAYERAASDVDSYFDISSFQNRFEEFGEGTSDEEVDEFWDEVQESLNEIDPDAIVEV